MSASDGMQIFVFWLQDLCFIFLS